jgi:ketosteroid isomerase-like protein
MGLAENKQIARAFYESANRGDMEGCLGRLADDVRWTNMGSTRYSGTYLGKKELLEKLIVPVFGRLESGIASTIDNVIAEGDFVVVQVRGTAETKEGRPYNNSYCHVFKMRDGKIGEVTEYFDTELTRAVFG